MLLPSCGVASEVGGGGQYGKKPSRPVVWHRGVLNKQEKIEESLCR